ncbi:hypothetical protein PHYSODRAFT_337540 [Phytophthora sojae]|uniref:Uncharacterized protein n=1 Tax=Phytophthora sojae (strain P6497) TaxID=1094619 RepID=G5A1G9_PHYSP|nr:hypothetical protein PHYSODRAFT_337540 [Phytophthora sojae]EGZ10767.1 hypothetical protein PHYSODRAFT_337540 [Phytophthora sojae]|eukprot:XP_009533512.1 hypothetical protein PHYSODRAFT_337540 [Phytophthora sojae]
MSIPYEEEGYVDDENEDADAQCSSAGESDYDLSDFAEADDVDMAQQDAEAADYPKLRVAQPDEEYPGEDDKDEVGELPSASSSVKDSRRRSVSFGPLPLGNLAEENVEMKSPSSRSPLTLEELSDREQDGRDRRSSE